MDKETFVKGMFILGEAYEKELNQGLLEVYYQFLKHLTPDQLERAARRHISRGAYFPKISELLQAVQDEAPSPIDLWNKLMAAAEANEEKPALHPAAERALAFIGGWEQFGFTPYDELKFRFKDFKAAYIEGRKVQDQLLVARQVPQLEG